MLKASLFFDNWYCENGLPDDNVCDRDKLFVSCFWKALTKLTGVRLKMSAMYHPETDGSSEHSNKTINQLLCYHITWNQKGWVCVLPHIRFQIMNTVNTSTGFSSFQLHLGCSSCIILPIVPSQLPDDLCDAGKTASTLITKLTGDVVEACDNMLLMKITQSHYANATCFTGRHEFERQQHSYTFYNKWMTQIQEGR
jgi:hypothetical protein